MACSGSHCSNNCYSNTCTNNRPSCSSNRVVTLSNVSVGHIIKAADLELLRSNTIDEINRWNQNHTYNFSKTATTGISAGNTIKANDFNKLINDLSGTGHGSTGGVSSGSVIYASKLASDMMSLYDSLRTDCVCNSDCGDHSVCSCHGNCGCNYSDERLKIEIKEL